MQIITLKQYLQNPETVIKSAAAGDYTAVKVGNGQCAVIIDRLLTRMAFVRTVIRTASLSTGALERKRWKSANGISVKKSRAWLMVKEPPP